MTLNNTSVGFEINANQAPKFSKDNLYIIFKGLFSIGDNGTVIKGDTSICLFKTKHGFYLRGLVCYKGQITSLTICLGLSPKLDKDSDLCAAVFASKCRTNKQIDDYEGKCLYGYNVINKVKLGPSNFKVLPITLLDLVSFAS